MHALIAIGMLCCTLFGPPEDSLITLKGEAAGGPVTSRGIVLSGGDLLVTTLGTKERIDSLTAVTADGRVHDVPGVLSFHWDQALLLLKVDWDGERPEGLKVRNIDRIDDQTVTMLPAGLEPVSAVVVNPGRITPAAEIKPDRFLDLHAGMAAAVVNDEGTMLGVVTGFSLKGSLPLVPSPDGLPAQTFTVLPGAWLRALFDARRDQPIPWAQWHETREARQEIREKVPMVIDILEQRPEAVAGMLREIIDDAPTHPEAWYLLSRALAKQEKYDDARKAAERALELDPASHDAAMVIAASAMKLDDLWAVQAITRRAILMPHKDLHAYYLDAAYLYNTGQFEEANEAIDRVLDGQPDNEKAVQLKKDIGTYLERSSDPP